jgi:hypothetical protein
VIIFALLVGVSYMCYKKKNKPDPYMMQKYTVAEEEEIKLDEDGSNQNDALNLSGDKSTLI